MFEQAQLADQARLQESAAVRREQWELDDKRTREVEAALERAAGVSYGHPNYWEQPSEIREQARRSPSDSTSWSTLRVETPQT